MGDHHGVQGVAERTGQTEFRPQVLRHLSALGVCFGAIAFGGLEAAVDAQAETGHDVGDDWGEDEEGFEGEGLVVGPCEEERVLGFLGREGEQRYQGCVGVVADQVEGGRDGGVLLEGEEDGWYARGRNADIVGCAAVGWEVGRVLVGRQVFWVHNVLLFDVGVVERRCLLIDWGGFKLLHGVRGHRGDVLELRHLRCSAKDIDDCHGVSSS